MEVPRHSCRLCLSTTDFIISLFSNYCRKNNMVEKIFVCLKLAVEQSDYLTSICYKCAENIERYYDFLTSIKKSQMKLAELVRHDNRILNVESRNVNRRHVTSYVREQVIDADYTFSFLDMSNNEEKHETRSSSPFFSYFSPPNALSKKTNEPYTWKTPRFNNVPKSDKNPEGPRKRMEKPRQNSRDLFESQSQDIDESELRSLDWKLTPDETLIRRVREKCFGRSDF